jgi:hypothetical protein
MKHFSFLSFKGSLLSAILLIAFSQTILAQATPPPALPDTSKMTYNQISSAMKLYVYPSKDQSKQKQKEDEF